MIREHHKIRACRGAGAGFHQRLAQQARWLLLALCLLRAPFCNAASTTEEWTASIADLFSAAEAREFAATMSIDRPVTFRVRVPKASGACGVMVFVKPTPVGDLSAAWVETLDAHNLMWVSADDFGNKRPSAQRVVMTLMAVKFAATKATVNPRRV